MKKKKRPGPVLLALCLIIFLALIWGAYTIISRYIPTKERMESADYFGTYGEDEAAVVLDDTVAEFRARLDGERIYLSYEAVSTYLNNKFYWDTSLSKLLYTTPTELIQIPVGTSAYTVDDEAAQEGYTILVQEGDTVYIDLEFVKKYTAIDFHRETEPNRVVITSVWGERMVAEVNKDTAIRYQGGIKSPILTDQSAGARVYVLEQLEDWTKVLSENGYIGYIQNKRLDNVRTEVTESGFEEPVYTNQLRDHRINLVWHMVTNPDVNGLLEDTIKDMTGVNVISPTWYAIKNNAGDIQSYADKEYVKKAHAAGLEVWALIDNFTFKSEVDMAVLLSSYETRAKMADYLVSQAGEYGFEGINLDFEAVPEEAAASYLQFIRELSIKCREAGLVLSSDVTVPMPFSAYYDRGAQGEVIDYVIMMGYDEHYDGSEAGSVASLSFEENGIKALLEEVPKEKIISAVPFYTRLWRTKTNENGETEVSSEILGMDSAGNVLTENGASASWNAETSQQYAQWESGGALYQIWFENELSLEVKAGLVKTYDLGGIAAWCLTFERPEIWKVIEKAIQE